MAVDVQTVKALLTEQALARLETTSYRFCADARCDVVYFGGTGSHFGTADLRVPVWQKLPSGSRPVCYCFGESEASIPAEIELTGRSLAVDRIREHIRAERCACDVRNPRGTCCLGDVIAAVKRVDSRHFGGSALPQSLVVVGAGPLGLEFGQLFSRFGVRVTILQRPASIVPRTEPARPSLDGDSGARRHQSGHWRSRHGRYTL